MTLGQKSSSNILRMSFMACNANISFFFDRWWSYLAQLLLMVCKLQRRLQIIAMTLESEFKVKIYLDSILRLVTRNPLVCYDIDASVLPK